MKSTSLIVLLIALLGQSLAFSQSSTPALTLKGTCDLRDAGTSISACSVAVAGAYAYLACSWGGLLALDVHDPTQPRVVGVLKTGCQAMNVRVHGHHAYLTDSAGGLRVIDVSDPTVLNILATWNTVGRAVGICLAGDYAYVSTAESALDPTCRRALEIVDVSDPLHPTRAGCFYTDGGPNGVDVVGDYAYLAKGDLQIINVSNPARPFLAGVHPCEKGYFLAVRVIGDYAYVGSNLWDDVLQRDVGNLQVLNVIDPTKPTEVGRCEVDYVADISLEIIGDYAYVPGSVLGGLQVVDVNKPSQPVQVATFKTSDATPSDATLAVQIVGHTAYLANARYFHVAEIEFPLHLEATVLSDGTLRLSWPAGPGIRLQQSTSLANPAWQDLPDSEGQSGLELPMTEARGFFRLLRL